MLTFKLTYTTMGVELFLPNKIATIAVKNFAESLHAPKMARSRGKVFMEQGDGYYLHIPDNHTFIFHKIYAAQLKEVVNAAVRFMPLQYQWEETTAEHKEPYKCEYKRYGFEMVVTDPESRFFYQNEVVEKAMEPGRVQTIYALQTGSGKSLVNGTPVRIPGGWCPVEELQIGDWVIGADGKPARVNGVFPQGVVDLYNIKFADGRQATACGEHLWSSYFVNVSKSNRWKVRNTLELKRLLDTTRKPFIPLPLPEDTEEKFFLVDPYLLGALLGDGGLSGSSLRFSNSDPEVVGRVRELLPPDHDMKKINDSDWYITSNRTTSQLHTSLKDMGLAGLRSHEKYVPDEYLEGSIEQRWELLRGLMDTDGTVSKKGGTPSFCSTSRDLATAVQYLVRSLGGIAKISTKTPHYNYKGEKLAGKLAYMVSIRHPKPSNIFFLERKKVLTDDNGQYTYRLKLGIESIVRVESGESTCISVDNEDSLFVIKDWIVNHNTKSAQKVTVSRGLRTAIIVRPTYIDKWFSDTVKDKTGLREKSKHVEIVKGIQGIVELIDEGKSGKLDKRKISTIIIPTVSLLLFLKAYQAEPTDFPGIRLADFYNYLGVGQVIYDEVHEHFYTVYMSGIALNPPATVEMSATLEPGVSKQFIRDRYEERFPRNLRISIPYRPVVDVRALYYKIPDHKFATKINRMKMYNHKIFEQLLHKEGRITAYFDMVWDILERSFLNGHQKGQRALVFFSLVDSCKDFRTYLDYRLMKKGLNLTTSKYNAGDSYDEFMKSDIGVSTPGKAGTAVDIPGLTTAIVTIPIDDRQLNEQITGRPRALTQWDMTPKVFFLHGLQLDKHNSYLASRRKSLEKIVKSFLVGHSNYTI